MAGDNSRPESYCMCRDTATGEDSLGFQPYVEAIAEFLINEDTLAPITLSIEGQWGCGKSSFMQQLKKKIEEGNGSNRSKRKKYFTVWFNCWRYEKEDELWAAFAINFMEQLSKQLSWRWRQWAKIKLVWRRLEFKWKSSSSILFHILLHVIYVVGIVLFWAGILYYSPRLIEWLFSHSTDDNSVRIISNILVVLTASVGFVRYLFSFGKDFFKLLGNPFDLSMFVQNSNYVEHISFIEHFHSDFYKIVESYAGNSRVYVFVDDLDRCEVPKAAELMQALNLMISDKANVYFSIGIDRKVVSAGLAAKNEKVLRYLGVDRLEYGYDYIEKFIQLPFKVPSPKNEDFKKFMNPKQEQENSLKASLLPYNPLSKYLKKLFSKFKVIHSSSQSDKESILLEGSKGVKSREGVQDDVAKEESKKVEKITNDRDCDEKSGGWNHILEMVAPALDRNPRRMKQFINQFRFQRTMGKRIGLFSYDKGSDTQYMWNCIKLAKFVAICIEWPGLISELSLNITFLEQLQERALKPEDEKLEEDENLKIMLQQGYELKPSKENKKLEEDKNLEKWIKDKKLMRLLKYGCMEGGNKSNDDAKYTLSGLDFGKLLEISPEVNLMRDEIRNMEFVLIPAGEFMMGSREDETGRSANEGPVHKITFKETFMIGKYQVTQRQWVEVMGNNPSRFKGDNRPVENVSWDDIQRFVNRLNMIEGIDKYSLPSEAEWEYACRAGVITKYCSGNEESGLRDYSWYGDNSGGETHSVGMKNPNRWGVYDMHGNVWEWVQDNWHDNYNGAPSDGSAWEEKNGSDRVLRGGGWSYNADSCRSAIRRRSYSGSRGDALGFRLVKKL